MNVRSRILPSLPTCSRTIALALATAIVVLALPLSGHAAEEWEHKKKLSFDTTASGVEIKTDVTQLPMLVRLHSGNFVFSEARPDGADLRFFAADGKTPLTYHIENFDATNELANIWVNVPKLTANAKTDALVVVWGNPKAESVASAAKTYDAAQVFVYHFGDAQGVKDASVNANHAKSSNAKVVTAGPIGAAAAFDGTARIDVPASATLKFGSASGVTFSALVKPAATDDGVLYAQRDGAQSLTIGYKAGTLYASAGATTLNASVALKPAVWQHVALVAAAGKATLYVDGIDVGNGALALADMAGEATIGQGVRGELDEINLSATARSAGTILAQASSQSADSPLSSFSEEAAGGEASTSTFMILMNAVTLDGWIVIGLLIVMAIVSFYVMISKAIILGRIKKANNLFLAVFKQKSTELLTPGHTEAALVADNSALKHSPIKRLYAIGLHEISHRFATQSAAGKANSLGATSIDSIRAALEASMLRENQKLNSGIVLLTIAIAGGPFLGLLGTVVGVMITFAAIAAAGDVNVNAIAPGIAAALVATVAGLVVAIPALFGYNWLASQIKNATGDTSVFVEEFLTRSAEVYTS
ncbi:DUF2341 domain-containing protein [Actimicrobium sp. CCI2.3]|uniref:DUF2341 domain-containing protein n=1 Tax=Actimicrobium sp. CCI2.3 TaxID=3048616 RepID=UPI002AB37762|nr:DUF2341 domain-containing protein [Actimicrobium sp. CCI2.3]MDY7574732.1 DUF2341 domain-containing protein [Actimicrobium sp. CCI2.3]MEB0020307.1 DUF2341 domain-containing protein [Actimicrobium sp. CCI2.3]